MLKATSMKQEVKSKEPAGELLASKEPTVGISGMVHIASGESNVQDDYRDL